MRNATISCICAGLFVLSPSAPNSDKFAQFFAEFIRQQETEVLANAVVEEVLSGGTEESEIQSNHRQLKQIVEGTPFWSK